MQVGRTIVNYNYVWDVAGQSWVPLKQPLLEAGSVTIPGTVVVADGGGSLTVDLTPLQLLTAAGDASDSGNTAIITPSVGKRLRIYYVSYNPSAAVTVAFRFGAAGALFLRNVIATGGSIVAKDFGDFRYLQGAINESLYLNLSAAVSTAWNVFYVEVT